MGSAIKMELSCGHSKVLLPKTIDKGKIHCFACNREVQIVGPR